MSTDGPSSADIAKLRRIGAVRGKRLERALADASAAARAAAEAEESARRLAAERTQAQQDARAAAYADPGLAEAWHWARHCADISAEAVQDHTARQEQLSMAEAERQARAAACIRHQRRDDAIADHGRALARAEARVAEIRQEDGDTQPAPRQGGFAP